MLQYNTIHINIHVEIEKRGRGTYGMNAILKVGFNSRLAYGTKKTILAAHPEEAQS